MISYTVKAGDSLASIAREYLGSSLRYSELAQFNGIKNPNVILIGQTIRIPEESDLQEIEVTAKKIPETVEQVFALDEISGSASRDWILPALAAGIIYLAVKGR